MLEVPTPSAPSLLCQSDPALIGALTLFPGGNAVGGVHVEVWANADKAVAPRRNPAATRVNEMIFFCMGVVILSIIF